MRLGVQPNRAGHIRITDLLVQGRIWFLSPGRVHPCQIERKRLFPVTGFPLLQTNPALEQLLHRRAWGAASRGKFGASPLPQFPRAEGFQTRRRCSSSSLNQAFHSLLHDRQISPLVLDWIGGHVLYGKRIFIWRLSLPLPNERVVRLRS
jgi:hypothetical protein